MVGFPLRWKGKPGSGPEDGHFCRAAWYSLSLTSFRVYIFEPDLFQRSHDYKEMTSEFDVKKARQLRSLHVFKILRKDGHPQLNARHRPMNGLHNFDIPPSIADNNDFQGSRSISIWNFQFNTSIACTTARKRKSLQIQDRFSRRINSNYEPPFLLQFRELRGINEASISPSTIESAHMDANFIRGRTSRFFDNEPRDCVPDREELLSGP